MQNHLCIHGHFYQPPREDPWLREVLPEGSAAPSLHWNERISRESYGPLAWARRSDGEGRIIEIINTYSWISFNLGPTLLSWMERGDPSTYARIRHGDADSVQRWGHGNAMAQIFHHIIMPLASPLDKDVETAWGLHDFEARFKRPAEGMWLSEAAVDTASLEVLAREGVQYVILAPRQAKAVAPLDREEWHPVAEHELDVTQPYRVDLPSGRSIAVFFYHGPMSQAVAFERLLENGENFWQRIGGFFRDRGNSDSGLLSLATDGETYGHHFQFGEMALAYVLAQTFYERDNVRLTNFGAYLAERPPKVRVKLHEPSSWSCVHGVERWRSDCGCSTGRHPGWNQRWRAPLRQGLEKLKLGFDKHFFGTGGALFQDPKQALLDYGKVLAGSQDQDSFILEHFQKKLTAPQRQTAWRLLGMQQWGLASLASCAWFFDEISRIEPLNGLTYALRAMELCQLTGGASLEEQEAGLCGILETAQSNYAEKGNGRELYLDEVRPRLETPSSIGAQALLKLWARDVAPTRQKRTVSWHGVRATVWSIAKPKSDIREGSMSLAWRHESEEDRYSWRWAPDKDNDPLKDEFLLRPEGDNTEGAVFRPDALPWNKLQALALTLVESAADEEWENRGKRLRSLPRLFLPWQEAQVTQNRREFWTQLWPELAWIYVQGGDLHTDAPLPKDRNTGILEASPACLKEFLREEGTEHPDRPIVGGRVQEHVLGLLRDTPPLCKTATRVVERCQEIGLDVDWWPVQNVLWSLGLESPQVRTLAGLLGFKI